MAVKRKQCGGDAYELPFKNFPGGQLEFYGA